MSSAVLWPIVAFILGALFGIVTTVAVFRSAVAVLASRADSFEKRLEKAEENFSRLEKLIADLLIKWGAGKRWSDPKTEGD